MNYSEFKMYSASAKVAQYIEQKKIEDYTKNYKLYNASCDYDLYEMLQNDYSCYPKEFNEKLAHMGIDEDEIISLWKSDLKEITKTFIPNSGNIDKVCDIICRYWKWHLGLNELRYCVRLDELCVKILENPKGISQEDKVLFGILFEEVNKIKLRRGKAKKSKKN